ncbi:MAG TPA: hypothetical protein VID77_08355 [Stellaceae bacterium]|jgi:hypothetical protein
MKTFALAAMFAVLAMSFARAENVCNVEISKTKSDWQALHLQPVNTPHTVLKGIPGHQHLESDISVAEYHLGRAEMSCNEGNDHLALVHLNVARAILNLPEIRQHAGRDSAQ